MPFQDLPLYLAIRQLGPDVAVGRAMLFPEVEAVHAKLDRLADMLGKFAKETLRQLPLLEVHRRLLAREPEAREVWVEVEPARSAAPGWRDPVRLRFD
ncbi:MAG TPA: hypothetical protein VEA69_25960, partial [Tepidisphaeraceae bacterium]|nr:hypothetical protein [Tepidisphaeraceae bacterium]